MSIKDARENAVAPAAVNPGTIFISHSSADKPLIERIISSIPQSHIFYDVRTLTPGADTIDALQEAIVEASLFCLFISPSTPASCWIDYEVALARAQKVARSKLGILVCPIRGATYQDAPKWMQAYNAMPPQYSVSDIARSIKYEYEKTLKERGLLKGQIFLGRENLVSKMIVDSRTRPAETGIAVNFLVLAGIENMGRTSVATEVIPRMFPGGRPGGPVFNLPAFAGAVDLFLALRQDIEGPMHESRIRELLESFPEEDPDAQAEYIVANLAHFAEVNQTVIIRSAFGLRDSHRGYRRWVLRLFRELEKNPNIRVVWVSQRRLAPETLVEHPNLLQYSIDELDNTSMTLLLTELPNPRAASPSTLKTLAPSLNGHPATAYFVGRLVNDGQRSLESVLTQMQTIAAFQDRFLNEIITETVIGREAMQLLSLLSFLPAADYTLLRDILKAADSHALSSALGDLTDSCLLTYSMDTGYKIPEIVRSNILRNQPGVPFELLQRGLKYWARESPRKR